jgi:hypothetical protein
MEGEERFHDSDDQHAMKERNAFTTQELERDMIRERYIDMIRWIYDN